MADIVGTADRYKQFLELCRRRIEELNITASTVDRIAGLPERYMSTLLCGKKRMSVDSLFAIAGALALSPMFAHDADKLAQLERRSDWIEMTRSGPRYRSGKEAPELAP